MKGLRAAADINAQSLPRKGFLEDALTEVAGEKECIRLLLRNGGKHAKFGHAQILRLVNDDMGEGFVVPLGVVRRHLREDPGPGIHALRVQQLSRAQEYRTHALSLLGTQAVLAPKARHLRVGVQRVDLPRVDDRGGPANLNS